MSNSSVVTAFRDALRKINIKREESNLRITALKKISVSQIDVNDKDKDKKIAKIEKQYKDDIASIDREYLSSINFYIVNNKEEAISKIANDSSQTRVQRDLSIIEFELMTFEFSHSYSVESLDFFSIKLQQLSDTINLETNQVAENAANIASNRWAKIHPEQHSSSSSLPSFSRKTPSSQSRDQIKLDNLINKTGELLKRAQKEEKEKETTLLDTFLSTLNTPSSNIEQLMFDFIQFHQLSFNQGDKIIGTDGFVEELMKMVSFFSDEELKRSYDNMFSPEVVSLVNAFFTQRHLQNGNEIEPEDEPAFADALSVWSMNKVWMQGHKDGATAIPKMLLSNSAKIYPEPHTDPKKDFLNIAGQFYIFLVDVYESFSTTLRERRQKGYFPCLLEEVNSEPNQQPKPHTLYLGFENDELVYRTNLSGEENCTINKEECLKKKYNKGRGYREDVINSMFSAIKEVLGFSLSKSVDDIVEKLPARLSFKECNQYLEDILNQYLREDRELHNKLEELKKEESKKLLKHAKWQEFCKSILLKLNANPKVIEDLILKVRRDLLEETVGHYENIILDVTSKRSHTLPSKPFPFLTHWPHDENEKAEKIALSSAQKSLISNCVKAVHKIRLKMKESYWYKNMPEMYYFGKVIHSLGGFFNINRFCDFLLTTEFSKLQEAIMNCDPDLGKDKKKLKAIYKSFQDSDLSSFLLLLKAIKEGRLDNQNSIYQWLGLKNPNVFLDKRFQEVIDPLYKAADSILQLVRVKLDIKEDYNYNNLELAQTNIYSVKNSACIKRLLATYAGASPTADFSYTRHEQFSLFWNPGAEIKNAMEEENKSFEKSQWDQLFSFTPVNTPSSTPKNSLERVTRGNFSPMRV